MSKKQATNRTPKPSRTGRLPVDVDALRIKIFKHAPKGLDDKQLCVFLGISRETFYRLKRTNSDFLDTLSFYDETATLEVLKSFKKVAVGFSFDETTQELKKNKKTGDLEMVTTKVVTKHVAPNASAAYNYLKNRAPEHFKDKIEAEHSFPSMLDHITFVIKGKEK